MSDAIQTTPLAELVARLSLADKVRLLTGASAWSTVALPEIGLESMVLSDGPSGVRGSVWDERSPSLCLPAISCLASSWDVELARQYGTAIGAEARRKGVHVVLGPTVNLQRSPLGGRNFEAFSEDPVLTADLATAYVEGLQSLGVAATVKHYVANDFETDRFTADVQVDERTLRELYLRAFEKPLRRAGAWCVMSAYNSINGTTATENPLLTTPLRDEWAFDGVVVSDWTAVRSLESARHPQDLAMPGPEGAWGVALEQAVRSGEIAEELIDRKVLNLLRLAVRVAALDGHPHRTSPPQVDLRAFARRVATEGAVLLRNDGLLPLAADRLRRVAVIGESARFARVQGGGSATVVPEDVVSPLDGLRAALPGVEIDYQVGAPTQDGIQPFLPRLMVNPVTGGPGAEVTFYSASGEVMYSEARFAGVIMDFAARPVDQERHALTFETSYHPETSGRIGVGFAGPGHCRLFVDGEVQLETELFEPPDQVQAFFAPPSAAAEISVTAGTPVNLRFQFTPNSIVDGVPGSFAVSFGTSAALPDEPAAARLIEEAAVAAAAADVAVVVVGTNAAVECEGFDRADLRLPGGQEELVAAVIAANPRTVVVVNSGGPVELPWRDEAGALLLGWFGGQEAGHALADLLLGTAEPGGRLAATWPATLADAPVAEVSPRDGVLRYAEGLHVGYRAWASSGVQPAFPFGFGLGYTDWELGRVEAGGRDADGSFLLSAPVTNRGRRRGKQVLQAYAQRVDSCVERPACWLVGFTSVVVPAGERADVRIAIDPANLAYWQDGWQLEPGEYQLRVGTSAAQLSEPVTIRVDPSEVAS